MSPFAWADASEDEGAFLKGVYQGVSTAGILGEYAESVKFLDDGSRVILVELDESSDEEDAPAEESGQPPSEWIGSSPLLAPLPSPLPPVVPLSCSPSPPPHQPPRARFAWGLPSRRYATAGWRDLGGWGLPGSGINQRENARKRAQKARRKARLCVKSKAKP